MAQIKQSLGWWCYQRGDMTPEKLVRTAAEIGYAGIELAPEEHWQLAKDHGLAIASSNGHHSIEQGLNRREHHERIERELLAHIAQAEQWNIANLICFSGSRGDLDDATGIETTAEGLRRVANVLLAPVRLRHSRFRLPCVQAFPESCPRVDNTTTPATV